jgi:hypothetical protein
MSERRWMIVYEDDALRNSPEHFSGHGAEQAAWSTWEKLQTNWNCTLFASVAGPHLNDRPAPQPPATQGATIDAVETRRIDALLAEHLDDLERFEFREDAIRELIRMTNDAQDIAMRLVNASKAPQPPATKAPTVHDFYATSEREKAEAWQEAYITAKRDLADMSAHANKLSDSYVAQLTAAKADLETARAERDDCVAYRTANLAELARVTAQLTAAKVDLETARGDASKWEAIARDLRVASSRLGLVDAAYALLKEADKMMAAIAPRDPHVLALRARICARIEAMVNP